MKIKVTLQMFKTKNACSFAGFGIELLTNSALSSKVFRNLSLLKC